MHRAPWAHDADRRGGDAKVHVQGMGFSSGKQNMRQYSPVSMYGYQRRLHHALRSVS